MQADKPKRVFNLTFSKKSPDDPSHVFPVSRAQSAITKVDLRKFCPKVYDQGQLGSCTGNAIGAAYEFDEIKNNEKAQFTPSRMFIYYNERAMEGTVKDDAGANICDGVKSIGKSGVCPEEAVHGVPSDSVWAYEPRKFTQKPPEGCYKFGKKNTAIAYARVKQTEQQIKQALINGFPVVFGFTVYDNFENLDNSGVLGMPDTSQKSAGGHAVLCVGFDDNMKDADGNKGVFIIRNSWGPDWGDKGYFYMPYKYLLDPDLADDFWTITKIKPTTREMVASSPFDL